MSRGRIYRRPAWQMARSLRLLADPETRASFGRRGREKVLSRYTWDRVTDAWEATYRGVLRHEPVFTMKATDADPGATNFSCQIHKQFM